GRAVDGDVRVAQVHRGRSVGKGGRRTGDGDVDGRVLRDRRGLDAGDGREARGRPDGDDARAGGHLVGGTERCRRRDVARALGRIGGDAQVRDEGGRRLDGHGVHRDAVPRDRQGGGGSPVRVAARDGDVHGRAGRIVVRIGVHDAGNDRAEGRVGEDSLERCQVAELGLGVEGDDAVRRGGDLRERLRGAGRRAVAGGGE